MFVAGSGATTYAQWPDLIPGTIGLQIHLRDHGMTHKETFTTGSETAAGAGASRIFDLPIMIPAVRDLDGFRRRIPVAAERSYANYGLCAVLEGGSLDPIEPLIEALRRSGRQGYNAWPPNEAFSAVTSKNGDLKRARRNDSRPHFDFQSAYGEVAAPELALQLAEITVCGLHFHDLIFKRALGLIRDHQQQEVRVTSEAGPALDRISADDRDRLAAVIKVTPAIQGRKDARAPWIGPVNDSVDRYATDQAAHSYEEKVDRSWHEALPGAIGVETSIVHAG